MIDKSDKTQHILLSERALYAGDLRDYFFVEYLNYLMRLARYRDSSP